MTSSPVEVLKQRLANGEISIAEYREILDLLNASGGANIAGQKDTRSKVTDLSGRTMGKFLTTIFGSNSYNDPTDSSPLEITGDLVIYGTYFTYKKTQYVFDDLSSVGLRASSDTVNGIPTGRLTELFLIFSGGEKIYITGMSIFIKGERNKRLQAAYQIFSVRTLPQRYNRYVSLLNQNGSFEAGGASVTRDGYLVKGQTRVHIKTAAKNGNLLIGTSWGWVGMQGGTNPYEIIAGESGTGILSRRVKFQVLYDRDVVFDIIRQFSGIADNAAIR